MSCLISRRRVWWNAKCSCLGSRPWSAWWRASVIAALPACGIGWRNCPPPSNKANLEALLHLPEGAWSTPLDRLRRAPTRVSGPALVAAFHRLEEIRRLGVGDLSLEHLPLNRLRAVARYGAAARAQAIARMAPERRTATLLAFAQAFERTAMDDALDLFDLLVTDIVRGAHKEGEQTRLRTLHDLDAAALHLWEALQVLLDQHVEAGAIRTHTFARVCRASVSWRRAPKWNS